MREKPSGSDQGEDYAQIPDKSDTNAIEHASVVKIEKIGDLTPIQDFEAMISRGDSPEWVDKAIKEMKTKILELLKDTSSEKIYPKALEYLVALRKACILEQVWPRTLSLSPLKNSNLFSVFMLLPVHSDDAGTKRIQ